MARYLLDSNALIWFQTSPGTLRPEARREIESSKNQLFLSLASVWELAIKVAAGKMEILRIAHWIQQEPDAIRRQLRDANIGLIDLELDAVLHAAALPRHHGDPFDRMVIAQAMLKDLTIVTSDAIFSRYGVPVLPA